MLFDLSNRSFYFQGRVARWAVFSSSGRGFQRVAGSPFCCQFTCFQAFFSLTCCPPRDLNEGMHLLLFLRALFICYPLRYYCSNRHNISCCIWAMQVSCNELSDADTQYFAVIANGEFIKTNVLPTTPTADDWRDLLNQASASIFTLKFGSFMLLGILVCCMISCLCRRCQKNHSHRALHNKHRRKISTNRGGSGNGRKLRPQQYHGPSRRYSKEHYEVGSRAFLETFRKPGPRSVSGRSVQSGRSGRSGRGPMLTGGGALLPAELSSEFITAPAPQHEICPECGLRLPDVVQLVHHVETQHGGRASRRNAVDLTEVEETKVEAQDKPPPAELSESVLSKPSKPSSLPSIEKRTRADADTVSAPRTLVAHPNPSRHASAITEATAVAAAVTVPMVFVIEESKTPDRGSRQQSTPEEAGSPLPRILPRPLPDVSGHGRGRDKSRSTFADSSTREAGRHATPPPPPVVAGQILNGSRGTGKRSRNSAVSGNISPEGSCDRVGRGRERKNRLTHESSRVNLARQESARSLTRTTSLDRISALSSRAVTRLNGRTAGEDNDGGRKGGAAAAPKHETPSRTPGRRRIRKTASTEDMVPPAQRLTVENLKALGSGLPPDFSLPPPVFSPVKAAAKEPPYSPVARARAAEMDDERPVSLTKKILRQLSGDL